MKPCVIFTSLLREKDNMKRGTWTKERREKLSFAIRGSKSCHWKGPIEYTGEKNDYNVIHDRMSQKLVKPTGCSICGTVEKELEMANKSGAYREDEEDWIFLCKKCHRRFDSKGFKLVHAEWHKLCKNCNQFLLAHENFYKRKTLMMTPKNGKPRPQAEFAMWCKPCTRTLLTKRKIT